MCCGHDGKKVGFEVDELACEQKRHSRDDFDEVMRGAVGIGISGKRFRDVVMLEESEVEDLISQLRRELGEEWG